MTKIIWMSDTHYSQDDLVLNYNPRIRLQAAVDHINAHHSDADMCVITGDTVNRGTETDYQGLKKHLQALSMPYLPLVGNHDDRDLFRQLLPLPATCMDEFIQYQIDTPDGMVLCLDTKKVGSDAGEFCHIRKEWLKTTLIAAGETPVILFMHHPPMELGLPMQDTENMENGREFIDLVSGFSCVKYLFIGHVHRPITGTIANIPFSTMRSVLYQAPPPRPAWTWETFHPSEEAPNIGVIEFFNSSINLKYDQFCDHSLGFIKP